MKKSKLLIITALITLAACTEKIDPNGESSLSVTHLEGKVEKGPFTQGSTVTIQEMNRDLSLTGNSFQTDIRNNEGEFKIESSIEFASPYVQLSCDGYFFNEVKGELSGSQIRLESIVDIKDKRSININVLTHLSKDRIINLMNTEGLSYQQASSQATLELLTCFGLQEYKDLRFEDLSITSGESGSGVLIMISSILLTERSEAELTEYISKLKEAFTSTGTLPDSDIQTLREKSQQLSTEDIANNILSRYQDLGKKILVPDLKYYIDWDGDGTAGNELGDPDIEKQLFFEKDTLFIKKEGGEFRIQIYSNVPFAINTNDNSDIIEPNSIFSDIKLTNTSIVDKELIVNIDPASDPFLENTSITICTMDQSLCSTLTIVQEGDFSNEMASDIIKEIMSQAANAFDYTHTLEAFYTNCYTTNSSQWSTFASHQISAGNSVINDAWATLYRTNRYLNVMEEATGSSSQKYLIALRSILYQHLISLWGDVPYIRSTSIDISPSRTAINDIYATLQNELKESISEMPDEINKSYLNVSKNVLRALLAKLMVEQEQYSEALIQLQSIISSGSYTLNNNINDVLLSAYTEMIYAINKEDFETPNHSNNIHNGKYLPLIQYSEILLLAAECSYKMGDTNRAIDYLNQIRNRNNQTAATSNSFETDLKETWKTTLKGGFSYFNFLKRNDLAINELNIKAFQKLLPIPALEISWISQNPGY